ncbi:MAG: ABC transporter substrate-binding protein [Pseudomonadota bacterium]
MPSISRSLSAVLALSLLAGPAIAAEEIKIGMIATFSGPPAALGNQMRDGFMLALEEQGGTIGGLKAEVIVEDDELKPDVAITRAKKLIDSDEVDVVVGTIFSNMLAAIYKPVTESDTILISPNAGPSIFAGRACHPNFFATSYQNNQNAEAMGEYASTQDFGSVFLLAPNYQAGRDQLEGFKSRYTGKIADEIYTPLGHKDFSAEIARIAASGADAIYTFMPGGMGVRLVRQFREAGLAESVTFLSAFTVDETTLPAQKDAAAGFFSAGNWAPDLDNAASKAFVAAFEEKYGYVPGGYAMQGYDTVKILDAAVSGLDGDLSDLEAMRNAILGAEFTSLRGDFFFNTNHFPIQDFYVMKVAQRDDGAWTTSVFQKVLDDAQDSFAGECQRRG